MIRTQHSRDLNLATVRASTSALPIFVIVLLFGTASARAEQLYFIDTIGTLGGDSSRALAVNSAGEVVGWARTAGGQQRAFLFDGTIQDIGAGDGSVAHDINSNTTVVGGTATEAFRWKSGTGVVGIGGIEARGINDSEEVIGTAEQFGFNHTNLWDASNGSQVLFPTDPGEGRDINEGGEKVGTLFFDEGYFSDEDDVFGPTEDISPFVPNRLNDNQSIAGSVNSEAAIYDTNALAFSVIGGLSLFDESDFLGINNNDVAVGFSDDSAIIWDTTFGVRDLNTLTNFTDGWTKLLVASDISDEGHIVGWGLRNGQEEAFLLTAVVPEPASLVFALTAAALLLLVRTCKRRR